MAQVRLSAPSLNSVRYCCNSARTASKRLAFQSQIWIDSELAPLISMISKFDQPQRIHIAEFHIQPAVVHSLYISKDGIQCLGERLTIRSGAFLNTAPLE